MSTRCEDVTDRLMELLYQELPADERGVLEAHVAGCDRCRAELASFQRTRSLARAALDVPAPAGVHQRLVAAAVLEAAARGAQRAAAPVVSPASVPPVASGRGSGLWQKLRGRWTLPTLATVGAMAIFLLTSRVFLDREATVDQARRVTEPPGEPPAAASAPNAPSAGAPPLPAQPRPAEPPADRERKMAEIQKGMKQRLNAAASHEERAARKPSPFPGVADEGEQGPERLGDVRRRSAAPARGASAAPPVAVDDSPAPAPASPAPPPPPRAAPVSRPSKGSLDDLLDSSLSAKSSPSAAPPATTAGVGPARAEVESAPAPAESQSMVRAEREATRRAKRLQPLSESASSARSDSVGAASESVEEIVARAERLFKEERWPDAVTLFERLLRRYPKNAQVPHWRQRLAAARLELNATEPMPP